MNNEKLSDLEPDDFYHSPEGYIIFTDKYHLKRGYCCKNNCKHCPFGYDKKTGLIGKKT
jgi:biotin synthase-like enzyme